MDRFKSIFLFTALLQPVRLLALGLTTGDAFFMLFIYFLWPLVFAIPLIFVLRRRLRQNESIGDIIGYLILILLFIIYLFDKDSSNPYADFCGGDICR